MNKSHILTGLVGVFALGLVMYFWGRKTENTGTTDAEKVVRSTGPVYSQTPQAEPGSPGSARAPKKDPKQPENKTAAALVSRPSAPDNPAPDTDPAIREVDEAVRTVSAVDSTELRRLITTAHKVNPVTLARFIEDKLIATGISPNERSNVIWLASKLNSNAMVPVWQGLLTRQFPALPEEHKEWNNWMRDHRNENLRLMQAEQLRALGGLGAMQENNEESREFLSRFVLNQVAAPGDLTMLRLEAVRQMQQHNTNSLLRLTKQLSGNDPLRQQLALYAKVQREEN